MHKEEGGCCVNRDYHTACNMLMQQHEHLGGREPSGLRSGGSKVQKALKECGLCFMDTCSPPSRDGPRKIQRFLFILLQGGLSRWPVEDSRECNSLLIMTDEQVKPKMCCFKDAPGKSMRFTLF